MKVIDITVKKSMMTMRVKYISLLEMSKTGGRSSPQTR